MLARIHIEARWAADLIGALDEAACLVIRRHHDSFDVLVPSGNGNEQARVELTFFLRAWASDYPRAAPRLGPSS